MERGPRIHVWALGRRSGKSTMAAVVALHSCLFRPDLDAKVRDGERRYAVAVATNIAQSQLIVAAARSIAETSPLIAPLLARADVDGIEFELPGGRRTVLRAFPCSSRGGRGFPISTLVMDEAAHFLTESEGAQAAERVWEALVPSTAQFGDEARIIVSSTHPGAPMGLFASLFQEAQSGELADTAAHHATTAEVNPTIDPAFLEAEQARDPDSFGAEYLAEFQSGGAAFLDFDRFEVARRAELSPDAADSWIAGLDPAFSSDPFGVALVGRSRDGRLLLGRVDAWKPRRPSTFEQRRAVEDELLSKVTDVCRRYRARAVTDQYAARAVTERLTRAGLAVPPGR